MDSRENIYVFVVCGEAMHINTLNFSISALKKRTKKPIWVVTDSSRNEIPITHEHIIHVEVPRKYSNHQASIFLKTGLMNYLPKGNLYCYLDSDVIAMDENPDSIFNEFIAPITFAPDHFPLCFFSPYAMNCGCLENHRYDLEIYKSQIEIEKNSVYNRINELISVKKIGVVSYLKLIFRYFFSSDVFQLNDELSFNKKSRRWFSNSFSMDIDDYFSFEYKNKDRAYMDEYFKVKTLGQFAVNCFSNVCMHLYGSLNNKFGIEIRDLDWRHWNGGVFLFSDESEEFMHIWHRYCLSLFEDSDWRVRDQAALIAAVWKFGLQNHKCLSVRFNFIVDYDNVELKLDGTGGLFTQNGKEWIKPVFVHVFSHFGDEDWEVWRFIYKNIK